MASYFSLALGSQMKHCDIARSCFSHQSPFFLNSAATLASHMLHSFSGTPCSSHHQPLWSPFFASATFCLAFFAWASFFAWLQPPVLRTKAARSISTKPPILELQRIVSSSSVSLFGNAGRRVHGTVP